MTHHANRTVRIFALYNTAVEGEHFGVVRSGSWAEVTAYLNTMHAYCQRRLFVEGSDGKLRPLMA